MGDIFCYKHPIKQDRRKQHIPDAFQFAVLARNLAGEAVVLGVAEGHSGQVGDRGDLGVVDCLGQVLRDEVLATSSEAFGADQEVHQGGVRLGRRGSECRQQKERGGGFHLSRRGVGDKEKFAKKGCGCSPLADNCKKRTAPPRPVSVVSV